ncbi:ethanolamine permease [Klebsiella grimontii]|nr:ethanolamine permease [Klebsiella grimontii]
MGINEIIMYIMMFFMLIAAVDRILSQFGGSARFLGKFGKSIEGSGGQFEEGFMAMGALGLAMVGMTALAPVLAHLLGPVIIPLYEMLGANPSMFAGTLLACDMGGFFLAKELAGGDVAAWLYSGLILGAMMGRRWCSPFRSRSASSNPPIAATWRWACWPGSSRFRSAVSPAVWWPCTPAWRLTDSR